MSAVAQPRAGARRRARRRRIRRAAWNVVGLVVFVAIAFPVFWMVSTAFKPDTEINSLTPTWFSSSPTLDHFRDAVDETLHPGFWDAVKNSLIIVGITVVLSIALAFLAAVALAKYRFTGRKVDRKSTRLNSSHESTSRMPSSA